MWKSFFVLSFSERFVEHKRCCRAMQKFGNLIIQNIVNRKNASYFRYADNPIKIGCKWNSPISKWKFARRKIKNYARDEYLASKPI